MKIITSTLPRVGSTLISNINTGLFEPDNSIMWCGQLKDNQHIIFREERSTFKYHSPPEDIEKFYSSEQYKDVYCVNICRDGQVRTQNISSDKYIVLEYENLLYESIHCDNTTNTLDDVLEYVVDRYMAMFGLNITTEMVWNAKQRVLDMDDTYDRIKNKPFAHINNFYHIHGSHRGRGNMKSIYESR